VPYISESIKKKLEDSSYLVNHPGEMNYLESMKMLKTWTNNRQYATIHELASSMLKSLLGKRPTDEQTAHFVAFLEFYRRIATPYENIKADSNGDLYAEEVSHLHEWIR